MSADEVISELRKAHQIGQEKYVYFLLAAAGAAIGFVVQKTDGLVLTWWLLPLGLATAFWSLSFYFGCKTIVWVQTSISANYNLLMLRQGTHSEQPTQAEELNAAEAGVRSALKYNMCKAQFCMVWQFRLFIVGAVFLIIWRIAEMIRISYSL